MLNCDEKGPTVMCLTLTQLDPHAGLVATGRVYSGSIQEGDKVYLVGAKKDYRVQQVSMYMGAFREVVNHIVAGNISALLGLDMARAGESLVSLKNKSEMLPFESIEYVSEPVITIAIEPKHPKDLPRLVDPQDMLWDRLQSPDPVSEDGLDCLPAILLDVSLDDQGSTIPSPALTLHDLLGQDRSQEKHNRVERPGTIVSVLGQITEANCSCYHIIPSRLLCRVQPRWPWLVPPWR